MPQSSRICTGFIRCPSPLPGDRLRFLGCDCGRLMAFVPIAEMSQNHQLDCAVPQRAPGARIASVRTLTTQAVLCRERGRDGCGSEMPPHPWVLCHVYCGDPLTVLVKLPVACIPQPAVLDQRDTAGTSMNRHGRGRWAVGTPGRGLPLTGDTTGPDCLKHSN